MAVLGVLIHFQWHNFALSILFHVFLFNDLHFLQLRLLSLLENCIFIHSCILKETFVSQRFLSLSLSFSLAQLAHKHAAL